MPALLLGLDQDPHPGARASEVAQHLLHDFDGWSAWRWVFLLQQAVQLSSALSDSYPSWAPVLAVLGERLQAHPDGLAKVDWLVWQGLWLPADMPRALPIALIAPQNPEMFENLCWLDRRMTKYRPDRADNAIVHDQRQQYS